MPTPQSPASPDVYADPPITIPDLLGLRRWNTPTIFNGLEPYTKHDRLKLVNLDPVTDFMPHMGAMVGYAVTLTIEPSNPAHGEANPDGWRQWFTYVASIPGPKVVLCQDLDKPQTYGACFGEVNCSTYRQLGCVGAIVDGSVRDVNEMHYSGLKVLAKRLSVSHAYGHPVSWGTAIECFGIKVEPGQLIHADPHGFIAVPKGDEPGLLDAARFMDQNENNTLIAAARYTDGNAEAIAKTLCESTHRFGDAAQAKFSTTGEWGR